MRVEKIVCDLCKEEITGDVYEVKLPMLYKVCAKTKSGAKLIAWTDMGVVDKEICKFCANKIANRLTGI